MSLCRLTIPSTEGNNLNPGQNSDSTYCAGYAVAVPNLNTTLSRVDIFEVCAVVEILLALLRANPRNVTQDISDNLRRDIVSCVRCLLDHRASPCASAVTWL